MFKKIKKNHAKLEFHEDCSIPEQQEISRTNIKNNKTFCFDDEENIEVIKKKIKPIVADSQTWNIQKNNNENSLVYSQDYLESLRIDNNKEFTIAKEVMQREELSSNEDELQNLKYQLDSSDDEIQKEQTKELLKIKNSIRAEQDFISFQSNPSTDQNWIKDVSKERIPMIGEEVIRIHGEYDSLPSGSDDEELNKLEQSIIRNNASEKRRAYIRQESIIAELGFKQINFNNQRSRESGDQKLIQKLSSVSFEQLIGDINAAITIDTGLLRRIKNEFDQLNVAIQSSENFIKEWDQQLEKIQDQVEVYENTYSEILEQLK